MTQLKKTKKTKKNLKRVNKKYNSKKNLKGGVNKKNTFNKNKNNSNKNNLKKNNNNNVELIRLNVNIDYDNNIIWDVNKNGSIYQLYDLYKEWKGEDYNNYSVNVLMGDDVIVRFEPPNGINLIDGDITFEELDIDDDARLQLLLEKFISFSEYMKKLPINVLKQMLIIFRGNPFGSRETLTNNFTKLLQDILKIEDINKLKDMSISEVIRQFNLTGGEFKFPRIGIDEELQLRYNKISRELERLFENDIQDEARQQRLSQELDDIYKLKIN